MSFALIFSGQGTQHAAMLPWLAEDDLVRATCARLGVSDWRAALGDPAWAQRNDVAQTLLTGLSLAAWQQLAPYVGPPAAVAGYSVGELAAFGAAGVFDAQTAAALAAARAEAMDRSAAQHPGGLLAVTGLGGQRLERLLADTGLAIAIRSGVDSHILGGPHAALHEAERVATLAGAQCTRLRVNVASHTPWMREAAQDFSRTLAQVSFGAPRCLLFGSAGDRIRDAAAARAGLSAQIAHTVCWDLCVDQLAARQVACVLEVGPGQALTRMWNQRFPDLPARACDDFRSVAAVAAWVNGFADA